MVELSLSSCPCCLPATLLGAVVLSWILLQFLGGLLTAPAAKGSPPGLLSRTISILSKMFGVLLIFFAIFLGVLETNDDLRKWGFSILCSKMTQGSDLDVLRCGLLEDIKGRVLEIGPGPATNFRCLYPPTEITEWVGVEPNNYFLESIEEQKRLHNISFSTQLTWLKGENIDVDDESFDAVMGTHVLCSVSDVDQVLRQVSRVLKPGGTYYFLEHVSATDDHPYVQLFQALFSPILRIVGNGCHFRALWENLESSNTLGGLSEFDIDLRHMNAPIGIPFLSPHIIGKATKRKKE